MPGHIREIDLTALSGDINLSIDPLSEAVPPVYALPPADGIEVIKGAGVLVIMNEGVAVTLGGDVPLAVGWKCSGITINGIVQSGTTVERIRVTWASPVS